MWVWRRSILTGKLWKGFVPGLTIEMVEAYEAGALAQDAFEGIPAEWREFLISGIIPDEWANLLPG